MAFTRADWPCVQQQGNEIVRYAFLRCFMNGGWGGVPSDWGQGTWDELGFYPSIASSLLGCPFVPSLWKRKEYKNSAIPFCAPIYASSTFVQLQSRAVDLGEKRREEVVEADGKASRPSYQAGSAQMTRTGHAAPVVFRLCGSASSGCLWIRERSVSHCRDPWIASALCHGTSHREPK